MTRPFKVGDTVVFNDYDGLREWFLANVKQSAFLSKRGDVMTVEAKWNDDLFVQASGWSGVLPVRFFKHAEGATNADPT